MNSGSEESAAAQLLSSFVYLAWWKIELVLEPTNLRLWGRVNQLSTAPLRRDARTRYLDDAAAAEAAPAAADTTICHEILIVFAWKENGSRGRFRHIFSSRFLS